MTERPIIFSGPMVRAILEGRKGQTRRPITRLAGFGPVTEFDPSDTPGYDWNFRDRELRWHDIPNERLLACCPYGGEGDRLWVRETVSAILAGFERVVYRADGEIERQVWHPSIHMPRWASRITLEITGVRVEQVQEITDEDARAEGITDGGCLNCGNPEPCGCYDPKPCPRDAFGWSWDQIYSKTPFRWHVNPWVFVLDFRRVA